MMRPEVLDLQLSENPLFSRNLPVLPLMLPGVCAHGCYGDRFDTLGRNRQPYMWQIHDPEEITFPMIPRS